MNGYTFDEILINGSVGAIYLEKDAQGISIGFATVERGGVQSWTAQIPSDPIHPYGAIDRVLHLLFVTHTKTLWIGADSRALFEEVRYYFEPFAYETDFSVTSLDEQNKLFAEIFLLNTLLSPQEHLSLENRPLAAQALAIVSNKLRSSDFLPLPPPFILDFSGLLELGNNALEQLEITSSDPRSHTIGKLIVHMTTPMGERLGRFRLFLPIKDRKELEQRYDWCEWLGAHESVITKMLSQIGDLEYLWILLEHHRGGEREVEACIASMSAVERLLGYLSTHKIPIAYTGEAEISLWCNALNEQYQNRRWMKRQAPFVRSLLHFIAQIDVAAASARLANRYALSRPRIIDTRKDENFLQVMGLRHLLVESQGIAYVANDIVMGNRDYLDLPYPSTVMLDTRVHDGADINGILLYGINSSGKSSLMKSIGIAIILAQAGFFVPARSMNFSLFEGVYTRIVSRDNVAKSLSTFGVEMLELNTIFHRVTPKMIVLGDEISHGTETLSAVAIVASTVMELASIGALFLVTTHLHQLSMVEELTRLRQVVSLHLSVRYDEQHDRLVYDRILKAGRGSSVYGLEFAESLHMQRSFLEKAKQLRENLAKEYDVLEFTHQKETIKRYRDAVASECVICGALIRSEHKRGVGKEHHHLIPLCDLHHRHIAEGKIKVERIIMTPQGLRLEYETQLQG